MSYDPDPSPDRGNERLSGGGVVVALTAGLGTTAVHACTFDKPYYHVVVIGTFVVLIVLLIVIALSAPRRR
jgi:hypothetical protein